MKLMDRIKEQARSLGKTVVLPDSSDERTLKAAEIIVKEKLAGVVLLGSPDKLNELAEASGVNLNGVTIVNPLDSPRKEAYVAKFVELRKHKGMTEAEAARLLEDNLYYAVMMIKMGDADCEVAGSLSSTGAVLKPAFQIVKTMPGISKVSGAFIMVSPKKEFGDNGIMVFADCAVNPVLTAREMAEVAICSAKTAKALAGVTPRVAMLSFATRGSAEHPEVDKVREATAIVREMAPDLMVDGEMQADAALVKSVGEKKAPGSTVAGSANVLVFPDLNSGNIGYKLTQRLGGAEAIGPILQGLAAPINDLSRGCSVDDIVNTAAMAVVQAGVE
jgi:phosphate acetyltransferase